jgi:electron transfer flavoprotein alpha subunit
LVRTIKNIWVYIDLRNRRHLGLCLNVISAARGLAAPLSERAVAVIIGSHSTSPCVQMDEAAEICISNGADEVYAVEYPDTEAPRADIHAIILNQTIQEMAPRTVLFSLTDFSREIAGRCARMNNSGLIADCVGLRLADGRVIASCPSWGGEIMAELTFSDHGSTGFATVQTHAFQPVFVRGNPGTVKKIPLKEVAVPEELRRLSSSSERVERCRLEDAKTVVVGGSGMGNADGFALIRTLSALLGGEVGATRPPVLNHWVDEERLIGQTGKSVRPELLISIGTSGAVQYTAGITESKEIIAINRDPDSPIFNLADTGIVADARGLLPPLISRIKKVVMRDLADVLSEDSRIGKGNGFGAKVRKLRESHGWSIESLAQDTGQAPEFIQQVESNEIVPPVSFLLRLSKALGVDPGTFLTYEEKASVQDQRARAFIKRTKNYYYQTLTPGAENQHLRGFMITIEPGQDHKPVEYKHEGEEFIYVMEGSLELTLDNKKNHLKVGESMHFNSEIPHKLKNLCNETTRCLVILYTP